MPEACEVGEYGHVGMQYGHWGITVSARRHKDDYAPMAILGTFQYPVSTRGPVDNEMTERAAIELCRLYKGEVRGPFFFKE